MLFQTGFDRAVLVDTSAVRALLHPADQWHDDAVCFWDAHKTQFNFVTVVNTSQEVFTGVRKRKHPISTTHEALENYWFLRRNTPVVLLSLDASDEGSAITILEKFEDHVISFHDAFCAAVMLRLGVVKVFSFDTDFRTLGFERLPLW
jgi:predicted nucleic acid-binding protein